MDQMTAQMTAYTGRESSKEKHMRKYLPMNTFSEFWIILGKGPPVLKIA
jgi:hypothetical protein